MFNVGPIDEFTREVADWLWGFTQTLDWDKVEVSFLSRAALPFCGRFGAARVPSRGCASICYLRDRVCEQTRTLKLDCLTPRQIEAKIGVLLDMRAGNQRVQFPVPIETSECFGCPCVLRIARLTADRSRLLCQF